MIAWLLSAPVAGAAGPLASTRPLPPCRADAPRQVVLPHRVNDLAFDPSGALIVADDGGLTLRDPDTLAVRARWDEGIGGWTSVWLEGDVVHASSALGPTLRIEPGQPPLLGGGPWAEAGDRIDPRDRPWSTVEGRSVKVVDEIAAVDGGAVHRLEDGALGPPVLTFERWWSLSALPWPDPGAARRAADRVEDEIVAAALDRAERRLAVATRRVLVVVDLERGEVIAREPLLAGVDAAGLVEDRLFTVSDGELALWDADGRRAWTAPGNYASAIARPNGRLLATTLPGGLVTVDLARGRVRPALPGEACLAVGCDEAPPTPSVPPSPPADPALREAWQAAVHGWWLDEQRAAEAAQTRPFGLLAAGPWVVAAEWVDPLWRAEGVVATTALKVLDAGGEEVLAERALARPIAAAPRFVAPDAIVVGDQAWRLPDLEPLPEVPVPPDGAVEVWIGESQRRGYDRVVLGAWQGGELVGEAGLPWRWVPELRRHSFAEVDDERFVVASRGRGGDEVTGPVTVWCRPGAGDGGALVPGLVAEAPDGDPAVADEELLKRALSLRDPPQMGPPNTFAAGAPMTGVEHHQAPQVGAGRQGRKARKARKGRGGGGPEVWVRVDRPAQAPARALELAAHGHPVRLLLPYPPQPGEAVPPGVGWSITVGYGPEGRYETWIVAAETALWNGPIEELPERLLAAGPAFTGPADPALLAVWREGPGEPVPRDPRSAERYHVHAVVRAALAAGHLDLLREVGPLWLQDRHPNELEAAKVRAALAVGQPFPTGEVAWRGEPPTGWFAALVEPPYPRSPAQTLAPAAVPTVAVIVEDEGEADQVWRALRAGVLPSASERLGLKPSTWVLVDPSGTIVWAGGDEGLADAVEAHGLRSGR